MASSVYQLQGRQCTLSGAPRNALKHLWVSLARRNAGEELYGAGWGDHPSGMNQIVLSADVRFFNVCYAVY